MSGRQERIVNFDIQAERIRVAQGVQKLRGRWRLSFVRYRPRRSDQQNAWLWGCIYPAIRDGLAEAWGETLTVDEVHEWAKARFLAKPVVNRETGESFGVVPGSTAALDTSEMVEYAEQLRKFAAEYLGVDVPDPAQFQNPTPAPANAGERAASRPAA